VDVVDSSLDLLKKGMSPMSTGIFILHVVPNKRFTFTSKLTGNLLVFQNQRLFLTKDIILDNSPTFIMEQVVHTFHVYIKTSLHTYWTSPLQTPPMVNPPSITATTKDKKEAHIFGIYNILFKNGQLIVSKLFKEFIH